MLVLGLHLVEHPLDLVGHAEAERIEEIRSKVSADDAKFDLSCQNGETVLTVVEGSAKVASCGSTIPTLNAIPTPRLVRFSTAFAGWALTMLFVLVGWVLFRASGFATAGAILGSLAGFNGFGGAPAEAKLIAIAALASAIIPSAHEMKDRLLRPMPVVAVVTALLAAFCVFEVGKGAPVNFIYFQF
jgi:hypothetical protein